MSERRIDPHELETAVWEITRGDKTTYEFVITVRRHHQPAHQHHGEGDNIGAAMFRAAVHLGVYQKEHPNG